MFNSLPLRVVIAADEPADDEWTRWPLTIPAVAQLLREGLELSDITILVGENGVGKSTLVEAIALAYGLSPEGGSTNAMHSTRASESSLHRHLRLVRGAGASKFGYFVRAETMHGLLTYLENNPGFDMPYHEMSHGEAFTALVELKLTHFTSGRGRGGLLVLDEPESGLSFTSQVRLANLLAELPAQRVQVLIATHSPILTAIPKARVIELDEMGFADRSWSQLMSVALYRRFLHDPGYFGLE